MKKIREVFNRKFLKKSCATPDEDPNPKEKIRVCVICQNGRVLTFSVEPSKKLIDLKQEVLLELYEEDGEYSFNVSDVWQFSTHYRLLQAESAGIEVDEMASFESLGIEEYETFLLQKRRFNAQCLSLPKQKKRPTAAEIANATKNVPYSSHHTNLMDINEIFQQSDLQFDVRKVIISLAQSSACIIAAGPHANKLITILKQKLANKRSNQDHTLQCLIDMGFSKEKSKYALKLNNGVYAKTLEWLLQHQCEDIPSDEENMNGSSIDCFSPLVVENSIVAHTEALLEIVRIYSHREIPPTKETVLSLVEMGFTEKEVLKALKKTCNNIAAACEFLCGNRSGSLVELREGLSKDSPILQSILELPKVQISLSSPKVFLAFLAILENENSVRIYGGDNHTTTVITHILQKYHEEKHALGINQFYNPR